MPTTNATSRSSTTTTTSSSISPKTHPHIFMEQSLELYKNIKKKLLQRYDSTTLRDIPGKTGFTVTWFLKKDGRSGNVSVSVTEFAGVKIEFTKNIMAGASFKVQGDECSVDLQLNGDVYTRWKTKGLTDAYIYGVIYPNKTYSPNQTNLQFAMSMLQTLLMA